MTIRGAVRNQSATVPIAVVGSNGEVHRLRALLDTGFNSSLILPADTVERLGLTALGVETLTLAGDEQLTCRVYSVKVLWHELDHWVNAYELGSIPVVGMALLNGSRITIDVSEDGPVTIEPLTA